MRGLSRHLAPPMMTLQEPSRWLQLKSLIHRANQKARHTLCAALHGGHELYRARSDSRLFQQCLLCGYETPGWTIDRRDRRLHLVSKR